MNIHQSAPDARDATGAGPSRPARRGRTSVRCIKPSRQTLRKWIRRFDPEGGDGTAGSPVDADLFPDS